MNEKIIRQFNTYSKDFSLMIPCLYLRISYIAFAHSCDGAVKIWDEQKTLMTEITLDDSLSSACFLTSQGDLMIGYKNHLFVIEHSKSKFYNHGKNS